MSAELSLDVEHGKLKVILDNARHRASALMTNSGQKWREGMRLDSAEEWGESRGIEWLASQILMALGGDQVVDEV